MKKQVILFSLAMGLLTGSLFFVSTQKASSVEAAVGSYSRDQATYYTSAFTNKVTSSSYGTSLLGTLHELLYETHQKYNTYSELWDYTKYTDPDLDNPGNIVLIYSRQSVDGTPASTSWNREHVWCKSLSGGLYTKVDPGDANAGTDIHHLRPASTAYNSTRGNTPYGVVATHNNSTRMGDTDCYASGNIFEPADYIKGDVARILMYMYAHYSSEVSGTSTKSGALAITNIVTTASGTAQSAWDLLMDWNELDPVDYAEMVRNNKCCYYLGNFNPFIDHPEYARMIWDDSSSERAGLCFQTSYKEVTIGGHYTNTASAFGNVSSATSVTYTSDAPGVATVDASTGEVTGVSNGVARIKARSTVNGIEKISCSFAKVGNGYAPRRNLEANGIVYTPTSASTAKASSVISSETVSFSSDYTNDKAHTQLIGGKTATMTITNFPGTVSSIVLSMHSNQSSGEGSITVTIGGSAYYSASGTFRSIYGSWSQSYVPLNVTNGSAAVKTGTIVITISASVNSLFFEKAIIDYSERVVTKATSIAVSPSSLQLTTGEDLSLTTSFTPASTTLKDVTWSSSNSSVATVNKYGLVRAISEGNATITATAKDGGGATGSASISVVSSVAPAVPTSITASVSKTYYVGETIEKEDITVRDDLSNTIVDFTFSADGYRFTYADASSGGALTNKTFTSAIVYDDLTCNLTVRVQRKEAGEWSLSTEDVLNRALTEVSGTKYAEWSGKSSNSTAVYAGQSAGGNDSIQIRTDNSNSGIVSTTTGGIFSKIVVVWNSNTASGRTLDVYGKNTAYTSPTELYATETQGTLLGSIIKGTSTELTVTGSYAYIGLRSRSGAMYLTSIAITYGGNGLTAENLANSIMYEDTEGQCMDKYSETKEFFEGLSVSDRATFSTSSDYVLSSARERLNAWASHFGESIIHINGDYALSSLAKLSPRWNVEAQDDNLGITVLIVLGGIGAIALTVIFLRRKQSDR